MAESGENRTYMGKIAAEISAEMNENKALCGSPPYGILVYVLQMTVCVGARCFAIDRLRRGAMRFNMGTSVLCGILPRHGMSV